MKKRRSLTVLAVAIVLTIFGLGLAATQRDNQKNEGQTLTTSYKIKGTLDPVPGYSFPKNWGRLVTYFIQPSGAYHKLFVFEAGDGTIRIVRVDLDWDKHRIEDADVITIGRD